MIQTNKQTVRETKTQTPQLMIQMIHKIYKCDFSDRQLTAVFLIRPILDKKLYFYVITFA